MHICAHAFSHCMGAIWWGQLPFQATELVNKHLGWFHEGQEELREAEPQKDSSFVSPLTSSLLYTYERRAWQAGAGETEETQKILFASVISPHRWLPGLTRRIALPRMIAGRIQAICRPNCRGTRLSKQRSWPIENTWTPSNQWENWGFGQGWATGMKDCRQCELQSSQKREGEALSSHWCCPCCLWVHWEAYSFSPSRIFSVYLFLHSL